MANNVFSISNGFGCFYNVYVDDNGYVDSIRYYLNGERRYCYRWSKKNHCWERQDKVKASTLRAGFYKGTWAISDDKSPISI